MFAKKMELLICLFPTGLLEENAQKHSSTNCDRTIE